MRDSADNADIDIGVLFGSLKRNWIFILCGAALLALLTWAVCQIVTPQYRAEARILVEMNESVFTRPNASSELERPLLDSEAIKSQVELIATTEILQQVATKLNLAEINEFYSKQLTPLKHILVLLGLRPDPRNVPVEEQVITHLRKNLQVYNVTGSRVIIVQYSSKMPKLAAEVANAIADEYIAMQSAIKLQVTGDATGWLAPEIADLSKKVKEAETKVADFRASADLLNAAENMPLATQQLSEISSELSRLRALRAASEAKAESIKTALTNGAPFNTLPEIMSSGLMQQLSERRATLLAEIANLSTTLLDGHPRIQALRAQLTDLDRQIRQEGNAVLQSLNNEVSIARSQEQEQLRELNRLKAQAARAGSQEVELRALEREATAQRELLQTYLARYREAASRSDRSELPADARVFSHATTPSEAYFPKTLALVGTSFAAGLLILSLFVLLRELFSGRALQSQDHKLAEEITMPPTNIWGEDLDKASDEQDLTEVQAPATEAELPKQTMPDISAMQQVYDQYNLPARGKSPIAEPDENNEASSDIVAPETAGSSESYGPNSVHTIAGLLIGQGYHRIIVLSPEGDEGAAGAICLMRELADHNNRSVLIDMTGSGAVGATTLDGQNLAGITDLLLNEKQFTDVIHNDHYSDGHIIPVGNGDPMEAMQAAERLPFILTALETAYDFVLIETGPATAEQVLNLDSENSVFIMSIIDSEKPEVAISALDLQQAGLDDVIILDISDQLNA